MYFYDVASKAVKSSIHVKLDEDTFPLLRREQAKLLDFPWYVRGREEEEDRIIALDQSSDDGPGAPVWQTTEGPPPPTLAPSPADPLKSGEPTAEVPDDDVSMQDAHSSLQMAPQSLPAAQPPITSAPRPQAPQKVFYVRPEVRGKKPKVIFVSDTSSECDSTRLLGDGGWGGLGGLGGSKA